MHSYDIGHALPINPGNSHTYERAGLSAFCGYELGGSQISGRTRLTVGLGRKALGSEQIQG
jgi:hypothetical protein